VESEYGPTDIGNIGHDVIIGTYEDRESIKDLYARYAQATDNDLFDDWADCFLEDGWMEYATQPTGRVTGRGALRAMVDGNTTWAHDNGIARTRHLNTNLRISIDGAEARGQCYVMAWWFKMDGSLEICTVAGYHDELRKVEGRWYFASRFGYSDHDIPVMYGVEASKTVTEHSG
jgi:3-phenylpropionate/cinnamic acid dioxygenase small subunit